MAPNSRPSIPSPDDDHCPPSVPMQTQYLAPEASASTVVRLRLPEFGVCLLMIGVGFMLDLVAVYQRAIPGVQVKVSSTQIVWALDPTLNKEALSEHVPLFALILICTIVPIGMNLLMNYGLPRMRPVRMIAHDVRDFLLSLLMSIGISFLITQFLKNMTGRFRPCFYDMCGWDTTTEWDGVTNLCTNKSKELDARRSFPSLHSSFSWATLFFLTLYLMGRARLNCDNRHETTDRGARKILKMFLCWLPTLLASWIAVTRSTENLVGYDDNLAGAVIGGLAAAFAYGYNYGSIFNWETAGLTHHDYFDHHKPVDATATQHQFAAAPPVKRRAARQTVRRSSGEVASFLKPSSCAIVETTHESLV